MKHSVRHDLGQAKAKQVAVAAFQSYQERFARYDPKANWLDDRRANISFQVKGMTLSGLLEVNPDDIEMDLQVPFMLRPFKGKALSVIEGEIKKWIGKANSGEL